MIPDIVPPLLVVLFLLAFDVQNVAAGMNWRVVRPTARTTRDYTIIVPVWGDPRYWGNREHLEPYKDRVLLACNVHTPQMAAFADRIEREGWRVFRTWDDPKISPAQTIRKALAAVDTTWVLRLDGDSFPADDFGKAVAAAEDADADVCSVKVLPSRRHTVAEQLQGVEYDIAMRGRHVRPWATSGACHIVRTEAMRAIMRKHSLWFFGEDIETGVIAEHLQLKVRHVDFVVYTVVPETFRQLFKQRRCWWAGHFRLSVLNFEQQIRFPVLAMYNVGLIYLLLHGKWHELITATQVIPVLILVYTLLTTLSNWPVRSRWLIAFPYYTLAQALIMPPIGALHYFVTRLRWRRAGRYRITFFKARPGSPVELRSHTLAARAVRLAWHVAFLVAIAAPVAVAVAAAQLA